MPPGAMSMSSTIKGAATPETWTSTGRPTITRACLRRFWRTSLACCALAAVNFVAGVFTTSYWCHQGVPVAQTDFKIFRLSKDAERHEAGLGFFQVHVLAHDDVAAP